MTGVQTCALPISGQGEYNLSFGGSLSGKDVDLVQIKPNVEPSTASVTGTGNFVVGNTAQNKLNLQNAYATMLGTSASNISVAYDASYVGGERYTVSFVGALNNTDIADKTFRYNSGEFEYRLVQDGAAPVAEVQRVFVDASDATGDFTLQLSYGGNTYKTAGIDFAATATQVQSALNAALGGLSGASVTVSTDAQGAYLVKFGGSLLGKDVSDLKVGRISVDPEVPSGNFTIELDGQMSGAIAYSADSATMAGNIQTALEAMSGIGAGNVAVTYDEADSGGSQAAFKIAFKGDLAHRNVSDITAHFGDLELAQVSPYRITDGRASSGEEQSIRIDTEARDVSFTLSLSHGGSVYTTESIALDATKDQVQEAVTAAFGDIDGAEVTVSLWTHGTLDLKFGGSLSGQDVALVQVNAQAADLSVSLEKVQEGSTETQEAQPEQTLVVDYSEGKTELRVATGPASSLRLDMDGAKGELIQARGHLDLDVFGFLQASGDFALEKSTGQIRLADLASTPDVDESAEPIEVEILTLGGSNV